MKDGSSYFLQFSCTKVIWQARCLDRVKSRKDWFQPHTSHTPKSWSQEQEFISSSENLWEISTAINLSRRCSSMGNLQPPIFIYSAPSPDPGHLMPSPNQRTFLGNGQGAASYILFLVSREWQLFPLSPKPVWGTGGWVGKNREKSSAYFPAQAVHSRGKR